MLPFFRKIRYQLAKENQFFKYSRYAVGEIVLVVIGILIALQINNWNEDRNNREKERVLLNQLRQEFESDLKQLNDKTQQRKNIIYSAKTLLEYIDNEQLDNPDSIFYHLQRSVFIPTFNTSSKDFFLARDIGLIRNDSLRVLLADWPRQVDQLVEEEKQWVDYRDNSYLAFLTSNFQTRNIYNSVQADLEMMKTVFLDKSNSFDDRIGWSKNIEDPNHLLENDELENHLGFAIMVHSICKIQSATLSGHIEKILEQIEEQ